MTGFFSDGIREQVRAANDIVDVIGSFLPLKRAGANFVALCPFHREKTPSFHVNPRLQIFHCFGCHKGGDVFTFVKEYESLDFPEAVRRLAERAKIPLEVSPTPGQQLTRHLKDSLLQINEQIAQRWQNALASEASGELGRQYLAKRGVSADAIKLFRIGAAPELWDDTVNWAKSKGHDLALVEKAGLIIRKEETGNYYDRFRGRLMFPICDDQGRVVGFSGRVLAGDEKTAKYVNSPETAIFIKSKVFFGLDKSKRALLEAGQAIVCEGQLDLIACFTAGVQNIVAPQGTAFTADHARILKRFVEEVVLCFDSDEAGQKATVRALDSLLASGLAVRVAVVPKPHDPDSYIRAFGGEAFRQVIQQAEGFFDYYLGRLCATNDSATDKGRLVILRSMSEAVHKTDNGVLIDKYAQKTALRLGVNPDAVRAEFKKFGWPAAPREDPGEVQATEASEMEKPSSQEYWLLKLLLLHEDLVPWAATHADPSWIQHIVVRDIVKARFDCHNRHQWSGVASLLDASFSSEMRSLVTEVTADERPIPNPAQQLADLAMRLRNSFIDRQLATLNRDLAVPNLDDNRLSELVQKGTELREAKRSRLAIDLK
jgi:DNA primase